MKAKQHDVTANAGECIHQCFDFEERVNVLIDFSLDLLQQNCNCERIESGNSYTGIQFSKNDGISNTKLNFTLLNCDFTSSAEKEAKRLNDVLRDEVEDYNSVDFITFYFKSDVKNETVKIKDGTIL